MTILTAIGDCVYAEMPEDGIVARIDKALHRWHSQPEIAAERDRLRGVKAELLAALGEIAKGEGAFSHDPLEHASNTIDSMKEIARAAIAKAEQ